jgi:phosphonate transport system ATP-binding protein
VNAPNVQLQPMIAVRGLSKTYAAGVRALNDVNIEVAAGEFLVILGPSGAGKSTLLRCINRLVDPSAGEVLHNGRAVSGNRSELRALRRQFGHGVPAVQPG